jgi:chromosome partitioning protein
MRSIAMLNQKGGVGKTTTAVNVSAGMARSGLRVLLVDLDPQSHATMHVGIDPADAAPGVYELLVNGDRAHNAVRQVSDNLSIIPASIDLVGAELELSGRDDRELVLRRALEPLRGQFDVLLIDCPPSLGSLTINALAAVDEVIIPLQPHFLALQGLGRLLETVTLVRGVLNTDLRISGVVLCMNEKGTRLAQEVASDVREFLASAAAADAWFGARVFEASIRRNVKLAECPSFGQTIYDYAATSHGAEDYSALANEIIAMTASAAVNSADDDSQIAKHPAVREATSDVEKVPPAPPPKTPHDDSDRRSAEHADADPINGSESGRVVEPVGDASRGPASQ